MIENGFTPTFFLQLVIAMVTGVGAYYAIKTDLKNTIDGLSEEKRLREKLSDDVDASIHDVRGEIGIVSNRVSVLEGRRHDR